MSYPLCGFSEIDATARLRSFVFLIYSSPEGKILTTFQAQSLSGHMRERSPWVGRWKKKNCFELQHDGEEQSMPRRSCCERWKVASGGCSHVLEVGEIVKRASVYESISRFMANMIDATKPVWEATSYYKLRCSKRRALCMISEASGLRCAWRLSIAACFFSQYLDSAISYRCSAFIGA